MSRSGTLMLLGVLLGGCALPGTDPTAAVSASPSQSTGSSAVECADEEYRSAQETIAAQQRAFADLDYASALNYSSPAFRSQVGPDDFRTTIESSYAFLLGDPALSYLGCATDGSMLEIGVEVEADPNIVMRYRFVEQAGSWLIDVAGIVGERQEVSA